MPLLEEKLEFLRPCLAWLEERTPESLEQLETDLDTQDIIAINLERGIQLCVDMASVLLSELSGPAPQTMSEAFIRLSDEGVVSEGLALRMVRAVGFRNLSVHAYHKIDWAVVYDILQSDASDLRASAAIVASRL